MTKPTVAAPPKSENLLLNIACNVVAPAVVLTKLGKWTGLDAKTTLFVALAFPIAYGLFDLARRRTFNFLSALGFCSTLATGGLGLLKLQPFWFAVKEAAVPTLIGLTVLISQWSNKPLIRSLLYNDQVVDVDRVETALALHGQREAFARLMARSSWMLAGAFALSAVLNFVLARLIITAMPETPEFNDQLGRLTWISYIVIMIPSLSIMMLAFWRLLNGIEKLSGLKSEEIFRQPPDKKKPAESTAGEK